MNLNSFALHLSFHSEPEPPIKLERMEETTNKISLALEIPEEVTKIKSGGCSFQCTISFILRNSNSLQILLWVCKLYFAIRIAASWSRNSQSVKVKLQDTHHYSHIIIRYYMLKFYFLLYIFYTFKPIILFYSIRVFFFSEHRGSREIQQWIVCCKMVFLLCRVSAWLQDSAMPEWRHLHTEWRHFQLWMSDKL